MSSVFNINFCCLFNFSSAIRSPPQRLLVSIDPVDPSLAGKVNMANGVFRGSLLLLLADCWPPLAFLLMCQAANRLAFPHPSDIFHGVLIGPAN